MNESPYIRLINTEATYELISIDQIYSSAVQLDQNNAQQNLLEIVFQYFPNFQVTFVPDLCKLNHS